MGLKPYRGRDTRPAKCFVCQEKLYYVGHVKHKPECTLRVEDVSTGSLATRETLYAHTSCWVNLLYQLENTNKIIYK